VLRSKPIAGLVYGGRVDIKQKLTKMPNYTVSSPY